MSFHVIVLAAGQGKRMVSPLPKVAHFAAGRPLLGWVLDAVRPLAPESTVVVLGHGAPAVEPFVPDGVIVAHQESQLGTGDATRIGMTAIEGIDGSDTVLVLYGDMPLLTTSLLSDLIRREAGVAARMVVTKPADPRGYGRIVRDGSGSVAAVVEDADCTPEQAQIEEINAGVYAFAASDLMAAIGAIEAHNAQGELYLTDAIGILVERGLRVDAVTAQPEEVVGINSQDQLAEATRQLQQRTARRLADSGVWILDPDRTYIDDTVVVEPGCRIYPGVHLEGATTVAGGARVGPDVYALDTVIGANSTVWYSVLRGAVVGESCEVGPYASLRPGSVLAKGAKVGTFVETKNSTLGENTKVPHLTYLGDATVGSRTNIGAGTVTVNYDGVSKHPTEIGDEVFVGSDTMLVAPVKLGDRSTTGAGSVITHDVSEGALALERTDQKEIPGYADRREARRAAKKKAEG